MAPLTRVEPACRCGRWRSAFLVVLGLAVAATVQITGVLLVFALLVAPAGIARRADRAIGLGLALSVLLGLLIVVARARASYFTNYAPGFFLTSIALVLFVARARGLRNADAYGLSSAMPCWRARAIAVACGLVGWFVVLRREVFAGDALSHVAFTGALAAAAAGLDLRVGLFVATVVGRAVAGDPRRRVARARVRGRGGRG